MFVLCTDVDHILSLKKSSVCLIVISRQVFASKTVSGQRSFTTTYILSLFMVYIDNVCNDKMVEQRLPYTVHIVQTHTHGLL
jgi:hypothetical protein